MFCLFIFEVDFVLNIEDNLCLFALSWIEIKHKNKHWEGENSSIFIHKMFKETFIKRDIVNLQMRKNKFNSRRKWIENCDNKTLVRIQFILEVYVYRRKFKKINTAVPFYGQDWHDSRFCASTEL